MLKAAIRQQALDIVILRKIIVHAFISLRIILKRNGVCDPCRKIENAGEQSTQTQLFVF